MNELSGSSSSPSVGSDGLIPLFERYMAVQKQAMEARFEADALAGAGRVREAVERFPLFVASQRECIQLTRDLNQYWPTPSPLDPVIQVLVDGLFVFADLEERMQNRPAAEALRREALEHAERELSPAARADARRSIATNFVAQGRFSEALTQMLAARDEFARLEAPLQSARVSMDLADIYQWLGDYSRALALVGDTERLAAGAPTREGLEGIADDFQKSRIHAELAYYRGMINRYLGNYELAVEQLTDAVSRYAFNPGAAIGVQYQLAMVFAKLGGVDEFMKILDSIAPSFDSDERLKPKLPALLRAKAEVLASAHRLEDALGCIQEAIRLGENIFDPEVRWSVLFEHGEVLRLLGRADEAIRAYAEAVEILRELRRTPLGYRLDSAYVASRKNVFVTSISVAAETLRGQECAGFIEEIKSRSLTAALSSAAPSQQAGASELSRELADITRRLDAAEYEHLSKAWSEEARVERSRLIARRASLIEQLRIADPRWKGLTAPRALDVAALLKDLSARDQAAITLFLDGDEVTAVLLARGEVMVDRKTLRHEVRRGIDQYVENLTRRKPAAQLFDIAESLVVHADDLIDASLWHAALDCQTVVVSPHGPLHLLPWAGLTLDGDRLFTLRPIGVLPNLSCLSALRFEPTQQPSIVLVGPPGYADPSLTLEEAILEVDEISARYASEGRLATEPIGDVKATERALLELLHGPRTADIFHVCCHATLSPDEPLSSGLLLTDAKVDASEIMAARVSCDEVVLSACSTGWRPSAVGDMQLAADDCLGLPGAFLEAGARSVLVSIPPADEEATRDFMIAYHQQRASGVAPLESHATALNTMLDSADHPPEFWIGMTMYSCV